MKKKIGNIPQSFISLREVRGPVLRLMNGENRSVVEVTGTHLNLLDEQQQQNLADLYHRLFLSLDFPVQLVVRVRQLNIEAYLRYVHPPSQQQHTDTGRQDWQHLAQNHASFLRALTKQRGLFGRRFFLILPAEDTDLRPSIGGGLGLLLRPNATASRSSNRHTYQEDGQDTLDLEQAAHQLRLRHETIAYHLQSIGLTTRLLIGADLLHFYQSFFLPLAPTAEGTLTPFHTLEVSRDTLSVEDRHYLRVQAIETLPRLVSFGWLKNLIECNETFDLIHHLKPRPANDILTYLRRQHTHAHASQLQAASTGRAGDVTTTIASNDLQPLIEQVTAGEQSMFESSLHLIIRASSREELEQKTRRVASRATTTFTRRPRTAHFEQAEAFRACLPGQMNGRHPHLLPSSVISSMIPFFDHFIFRPSATAILEGLTQHNEPVILDWWADLTNANRLILGASGWGKSYKAKLDILHLYYMYKQLAQRRGGSGQPQQHQQQEGDGFQILIVDPERETDRAPGFSLIERLGGQSIRFSPGSRHHLNPLDLPPVTKNAADTEMDAKEDVLANHIQRLHRIFDLMLAHNVEDKASSLTPQEKSLLDATLYEAYRRAGISPDRTTHQRPAPLLRDVQRILAGEVCGPDPTGLAQRLRRYTDGSLSGLFSDQTNIDLHNTVIQFDVKELAEGELRPITLMMISNLIWNIAFASRIPRFLFIDEMATVGRYRSGQYFLEEIFQRARKHYLSVVGMTQEPGHLSKAIIANCASHVLLHQDDTTLDTITDLFKLSSREAMRLRGFDRGEALLLAGGKRMMVRFVASPLEDRLITTNRRQIAAIEATAATRNNQP